MSGQPSKLNPYISFNGNAREAMEFYKSVFGGELQLRTFKEAEASSGPSQDNKIMHSHLVAENGITIMSADTPASKGAGANGNISISLSGDKDEELRGYFEKLSEGAKIQEPLATAPWGDSFGMLEDKFGINWLVNITKNAKRARTEEPEATEEAPKA
jgi:PhnB protein